jgi:3-hydroxyacyl-CoA dehydrogenase / enoyl-CoA hydratase / 3-hydroxybutyryl-CoA epimerase
MRWRRTRGSNDCGGEIMSNAFQLNIDPNRIARLVFDLPGEKVNKLSTSTIEELEKILDDIAKNKDIKALVLTSGKNDMFIAGADLKNFEPAFKEPSLVRSMIETGHRTFNKLQNLPFPSIAVIDGPCLGGGLELALACTYRIVTDNPKTSLGLPETSLGIIPGWGGTQRLPRLVGLQEGLQMILTAKPVKALKAWKIKLADAIVAKEFKDQKVEEFINQCLIPKERKNILKRREPKGISHFLMEKSYVGPLFLFWKARQNVLEKTKGNYPAPIIANDLIKNTYLLPLKQGLEKEIETFLSNIPDGFSTSKHLIQLFFNSEAMKKNPGIDGAKPKNFSKAAVIGAGTMGGAIAWLFTNANYPVRMKDINWDALGKGYGSASSIYQKLVKDKRLKRNEANMKLHNLSATTDYSGFQDADIIVEAAVENLEIKHKIFAELEKVVRPDAIIGSNTSSLPITKMAEKMQHPERLVGMHFFNPPNKMPLVEIVRGEKTSPEAVATAVEVCKKIGKIPLVVGDCPGFLVNRIFVQGANEIMWLLEQGVSMEDLEKMMLDFGMPMSPFVLSDEVGNDVSYKVSKSFEDAYGERMKTPRVIQAMYDNHLYGKKSGAGFYLYKDNVKKEVNPEVKKILNKLGSPSKPIPQDENLRNRVMLPMINEAANCLHDKIITNPAYLDMATIYGIGFPPFRGGLLRYADDLGIPYIIEQLKKYEPLYGPRYKPSPYLLDLAANNKKFYDKSI